MSSERCILNPQFECPGSCGLNLLAQETTKLFETQTLGQKIAEEDMNLVFDPRRIVSKDCSTKIAEVIEDTGLNPYDCKQIQSGNIILARYG